jgi:hypothetical protein
MLAWLKDMLLGGKKHEPKRYQIIGYVDHNYSLKFPDGDKEAVVIRSIFMVADDGSRRVEWNDKRMREQAPYFGTKTYAQINAWEQGGPLPDLFTPMNISTRKPEKLPAAIRHDYNNR